MHRRHLHELTGKEEPKSGLTVRSYSKPFDFEYQVAQHLEAAKRQWPKTDEREHENNIRLRLAVGSAWLWAEPQLCLDFGVDAAVDKKRRPRRPVPRKDEIENAGMEPAKSERNA